jgi:hypothetical protein
VQKKNNSALITVTGRKLIGEEETTYVKDTQLNMSIKKMKLKTWHVTLKSAII